LYFCNISIIKHPLHVVKQNHARKQGVAVYYSLRLSVQIGIQIGHTSQKEKRTLVVRFSFCSQGLRLDPAARICFKILQALCRRAKGCRFCKAKWSAVPTRRPLNVRAKRAKWGNIPPVQPKTKAIQPDAFLC
jgi:hypothetical protein